MEFKVEPESPKEKESTTPGTGHSPVYPETNSGSGNDAGEKTGAGAKGPPGGGGKTLEDLIDEHLESHPPGGKPEEKEEEPEETEETEKKPPESEPKKTAEQKKADAKREKNYTIITELFIESFLLRIANLGMTGLNVYLTNMIMKKRGKKVEFDKILLDDDEMEPLNIMFDTYGGELIKKYVPPWLMAILAIEGIYFNKITLNLEDTK